MGTMGRGALALTAGLLLTVSLASADADPAPVVRVEVQPMNWQRFWISNVLIHWRNRNVASGFFDERGMIQDWPSAPV